MSRGVSFVDAIRDVNENSSLMCPDLINQDGRATTNDAVSSAIVRKFSVNEFKSPESGSGNRFAVVRLRPKIGALAINDDG